MTAESVSVTGKEALGVWSRVALQSFGGPAGQIAVIHRIIVDEKKWLNEERFLHALSYCMLLPGPEAQQLATYVGWLLRGVRGGLLAGCLFILPGFLSILVLSVMYAQYREVSVVAGVFFGLKPAVIAIVFEAVVRLKRRALTQRFSLTLAIAAFVGIAVFRIPFPLIVVGAALTGVVMRPREDTHRPGDATTLPDLPPLRNTVRTAAVWLGVWLVPLVTLALVLSPESVFVREGVFFSKTAVVTFGGAYAVLSYVAQQAVDAFQWLGPGEMLDGLGMAETTPGPLIQVVQFVGFMGAFRNPGTLDPVTAGVFGSLVTTWVTFAPCFLFIFVGAPYVEYLRESRALNAALKGITAAVVGVVLNLAIWFCLHTIFAEVQVFDFGPGQLLVPVLGTVDWAAAAIASAALVATFRFKVGMLPTLAGAALAGVALQLLG